VSAHRWWIRAHTRVRPYMRYFFGQSSNYEHIIEALQVLKGNSPAGIRKNVAVIEIKTLRLR